MDSFDHIQHVPMDIFLETGVRRLTIVDMDWGDRQLFCNVQQDNLNYIINELRMQMFLFETSQGIRFGCYLYFKLSQSATVSCRHVEDKVCLCRTTQLYCNELQAPKYVANAYTFNSNYLIHSSIQFVVASTFVEWGQPLGFRQPLIKIIRVTLLFV